MLNTICVAIDGSAHSNKALTQACLLAQRFDASLLLCHVVREMKIPPELQRFVDRDEVGGARRSVLEGVANELLSQALSQVDAFNLREVKQSLLRGEPAQSIVNCARSAQADLIVIGTRGLGQVEGMLIGSVSRKVTDISDISVLVVK